MLRRYVLGAMVGLAAAASSGCCWQLFGQDCGGGDTETATATVRCSDPSRYTVPGFGTLDFGQVTSLGQIWRTDASGTGVLWEKVAIVDLEPSTRLDRRVLHLDGRFDVDVSADLPGLEAEVQRVVDNSARLETTGTVRESAILGRTEDRLNVRGSVRDNLLQILSEPSRVVLVSSVLKGDAAILGFDTSADNQDNPTEQTVVQFKVGDRSVSVNIQKHQSCSINLQSAEGGQSVLFYQVSCLRLSQGRILLDPNCDVRSVRPARRH
jgi:hypothetical protein